MKCNDVGNKTLNGYMQGFVEEMTKKFQEHDNKWKEQSVTRDGFDFGTQLEGTDWLRWEISYHYGKWLTKSVCKQEMPEQDTLVNLANMILLLWIKLELG